MLDQPLKGRGLWMFDVDGTLVNSLKVHREIAIQVAESLVKKCGFEGDQEELARKLATSPITEIVEKYFSGRITNQQAIDLYYETFHSEERDIHIFPKAGEVIEHLKNKNQLVTLVTAASRPSFEHNLKLLGKTYPNFAVDASICNEDGKPVKPQPEAHDYLMSQLRNNGVLTNFNYKVMIGDSPHDEKFARNTDSLYVCVFGDEPDTELSQASRFRVKDMEELYAKLTI